MCWFFTRKFYLTGRVHDQPEAFKATFLKKKCKSLVRNIHSEISVGSNSMHAPNCELAFASSPPGIPPPASPFSPGPALTPHHLFSLSLTFTCRVTQALLVPPPFVTQIGSLYSVLTCTLSSVPHGLLQHLPNPPVFSE